MAHRQADSADVAESLRAAGGGCLRVVCFRDDGGAVAGVGAQVLQGLLALSHKLFERSEQQLGGGRSSEGVAFGRVGRPVHLQGGRLLGARAPPVGRVGALGATSSPGGARVDAATAARAAVHCLEEEAVS